MGDQRIDPLNSEGKRDFLKHLLADIRSLETMIADGQIETGITRLGAEQEFCLVGPGLRPSMTGPVLLDAIDEEHFTSELAQWNLEINLDPQTFSKGCFSVMHRQLDDLLAMAHAHAADLENKVVLTGILPTIRQSELDFKHMSPNPRYKILDKTMKEHRGEDFKVSIEGVDEVSLTHDSILFEACNTSFQIHLQCDPHDFTDKYNWSQVVAAPVMAAAVNSPILLGKELWAETRIALFRQSIDIRHAGNYIRERQPRVAFGHKWLEESAAQIFKDDVSLYELIISAAIEENSEEVLRQGRIPELRAMNLHNGTIYKWNRACYGIGGGIPHLRIENRYVPSGPTTHDEMANTAFWAGLMVNMPSECANDWERHFSFKDVRGNFLKAARNGLHNEFKWFGKTYGSEALIVDKLIPHCAEGLDRMGVPAEEYTPYLNTIQERTIRRRTGADWIIDSLRALRHRHTLDESILTVTQAMIENERSQRPVHEWTLADEKVLYHIPERYDRVDSVMTTSLITVREDDLMLFAEALMEWHDFTTLPVEDLRGKLVGLISRKEVDARTDDEMVVKQGMEEDIVTIGPERSVAKALKAIEINEVDSLPVVKGGQLVGMVTMSDIRALKNS